MSIHYNGRCYPTTGQDWEDLDKEMGELGGDNPEQIDRNMWVPEEEQDETEVCVSDTVVFYVYGESMSVFVSHSSLRSNKKEVQSQMRPKLWHRKVVFSFLCLPNVANLTVTPHDPSKRSYHLLSICTETVLQ